LSQDKRREVRSKILVAFIVQRGNERVSPAPVSVLTAARLGVQLGENSKAVSLLLDNLSTLEQLPDAELGDEAFQILITIAWADKDFQNAQKWIEKLFHRYKTRLGPNSLITLDTELNLGVTLL
jgi:hypothetical protein